MRSFCSILALAVVILVLTTASATAATVIKLDMPNLVAQSDTIVTAEVIQTESELEEDGRVYTTITFETDQILKGQPGKEFSIRQIGGRDGDIATRVPGMPDFEPQEQVFLFLTGIQGRPVVTGLSQGKFQIAVGPDDDTKYVIPQLSNLHLIDGPDARRPGPDSPDTTPPQMGKLGPADPSGHAALFQQVHQFDAFQNQIASTIEAQHRENQ